MDLNGAMSNYLRLALLILLLMSILHMYTVVQRISHRKFFIDGSIKCLSQLPMMGIMF